MLSSSELERLIAVKRREIEKEKTHLGLSPPPKAPDITENVKENASIRRKQVNSSESRVLRDEAHAEDKEERDSERNLYEVEENIPPDLERYIRRYIGLPVMLKAGEYSPNNPLTRGERPAGDALRGLGEYERRRNTLRKLRQHQYREYLDQQAKKKQEAKEQAEKERREREEKEREREEKERDRVEREKPSPQRRRASFSYVTRGASVSYASKVDTGVQVDSVASSNVARPLSVAVQTDDAELFPLSPSPLKWELTEAERELSPRTVVTQDERAIQPASWVARDGDGERVRDTDTTCTQRRRSYGDCDERNSTLIKKTNRDKLVSDLRHSYMPSIFDADAIELRNVQAEKDAAERRQFYQQELRNQIQEQQRIREERKSREKMLEQAEMRRLEEQLRMLRVAQEREVGKQHYITNAMKDSATDYEHKRTELQKEIDLEEQKLYRATSQPTRTKRTTFTSRSDRMYYPQGKDDTPSPNMYLRTRESVDRGSYYPKGDGDREPLYYPKARDNNMNPSQRYLNPNQGDVRELPINYPKSKDTEKKPYSTNIPDNSIFSPNYDVDTYLRRNLNFEPKNITNKIDDQRNVIERVTPKKSMERRSDIETDPLPIPVLRHSPSKSVDYNENCELSEAMKKVDDKWRVPVVQKNILKAMPNEEGKSVNILTQLGSIRRQLQLEQLKLDQMLNKDDV